MPLQVSDSLEEVLEARASPSAWASFTDAFTARSYFRPLRLAGTKLLFDAAQGRYFVAYKAFHVTLLFLAFLLLVRAFHVEDANDLAAAIFALTVFSGLHTFHGFVREAFPINHFLQVAVLCLAALNVVQARHRWWTDVAANLCLVAACLTLESGVLVWVVLVAGRLVGWQGVSRRGIAAATLLLGGYLALRFIWLSAGLSLVGNASGYFTEVLEPRDIHARFQGRMWWYHAYTILAQVGSILFSEPRRGVWITAGAWLAGNIQPRQVINVATSAATTGLLVWAALDALRRPDGIRTGRYLLMFSAVLCANAVASFAYAKDEIVSVAGTFYALAAFAAVRHLLARPNRRLPAAALGVLLIAAASGWAVRTIGVHHVLRTQAFNHRNDWARVVEFLQARGEWPSDPGAQSFVLRLQAETLAMPVTNPWFMQRWADRVFDVD